MKSVFKTCLFALTVLAISILVPGQSAKADVAIIDRDASKVLKTSTLDTGKIIVSPMKSENKSNPTSVNNKPSVNVSRGGGGYMRTKKLVLSFYTDLPEENGGWVGVTSIGTKLRPGVAASVSALPFGTLIYTQQYGTLTIEDSMHTETGYKRCEAGEVPVDVFVARQNGESDDAYKTRVRKMGIQRISAEVYYQ